MRLATEQDIRDCLEYLRTLPTLGLMCHADDDAILANLLDAVKEEKVLVFNGYLYYFEISKQWWSKKTYLCEEFFMRMPSEEYTPPEQALTFLETLAKAHGCDSVVASDFLTGQLGPSFIRLGYVPLGTMFFKDV